MKFIFFMIFLLFHEFPPVTIGSEINENQWIFMKNRVENHIPHMKSRKKCEKNKFHRKIKTYGYKYLLEGGWARISFLYHKNEGMQRNTKILTVLTHSQQLSFKIIENAWFSSKILDFHRKCLIFRFHHCTQAVRYFF